MPPAEVTKHYFKYFGPTKTVYDMLDDKRKDDFETALTALWEKNNTSSDSNTEMKADYLEVIAVKK
jgi:hypothetical protein